MRPAAAFIVQEVGPQEVGVWRREALGVGAVDVRQPPHSTFKIWNTPIALETGAAPDAGFQQRYDPVKYPREDWWPETWLQDQTLESISGARRVVLPGAGLLVCGGGGDANPASGWATATRDISSGLDSLAGGSLRISPREQVALAGAGWRAARCRSARSTATLRRIMVLDQGEGWTLSGKTGLGEWAWAGSAVWGRFEGWFVGWRSGGPDLRLRHLPARPRHEDLRPAPHRADLAGAGVAGRAAGSDG